MENTSIKQLIANGDTEAAFRRLLELARGKSAENEALLLAARFQKYQQNQRLGTAGEEESRQELNRINLALLQLSDTLPGSPEALPDLEVSGVSRQWYWLALALAGVVALAWYFSQRRPAQEAIYQFQYKQHGIPTEVLVKIDSLQKAGQLVRELSFGPNAEWAIFYGRNHCIHNGELPQGLIRQLDTLKHYDGELKGLYLGANSEALLRFNRNDFWHTNPPRDMPRRLVDSLYLYYHQNRAIKDVGIGPDYSWVILWDQTGFTYEGVHDSLAAYIRRTSFDFGQPFKGITFSNDGGWVLLYGYNGYWQGFVDAGLPKTMDEVRKEQREILNVFMRRGDEWIVLYR